LREEHRLGIFENEAKKISGHTCKKVTGGWKTLRSEELRDMYSMPNGIRMVKPGKLR
jgi:hypothetical protein